MIKVWLYLGPSCTDCPFSEELSAIEVDSLGLIQTPEPTLPLCQKGLTTPGLVRWIPFQRLSEFYLFIALVALRRVPGAAMASRELPTYLRRW
jgi:hypothetical protein